MSAVALRPYLPADAKRCAEIFRSSIEELAAEDYDERAARGLGVARRRRSRRSARRLAEALTLLAVIDGAVAGFASLKGADQIDMLFVDPEFARQGVGRTLVDALDKTCRGARRKAPDRRGQRCREAPVRAPGLRGAAAQSRPRRRPMARQHHHGQDPRGRSHAPDPAALMFPAPRLVLRSGAVGVASRRTFQTAQTPPPGACFEPRTVIGEAPPRSSA